MGLAAVRRRWGVFLIVLLGGLGVVALLDRAAVAPSVRAAEARVRLEDPSDGLTHNEAQWAAVLAFAFPDGRPLDDPKARSEAIQRVQATVKDDEIARMVDRLRSSVTLRISGSRVIVRAVGARDDEAARMANAVAFSLVENADLRRMLEGRALEEKAQELRERLERDELAFTPEEERLEDLERRKAAQSAAAVQVERRIEDNRARQDRTLARIRSLEAAEHRLRESLPSGPEEYGLKSAVLDRLRREMNAIRSEIALRRLGRTPDHADYKRLTARLADLDEEHRAELYRVRGSTIVSLREEVNRIEDERRLLEERQMRHSLELHGLGEEIRESGMKRDALARTRQDMAETVERRRLLKREPAGTVEDAARSASVSGGNGLGLLWPAGAVAALLLAAGAAVASERGDVRVRTDADVKRHLNLATLAVVEDPGLVLRAHPSEPVSETYSAAAAVLRGYLKERDFKVCAVTSAGARDGKSTAAANLAVALARKGLNVALVDGDLRVPRLHEIFGVENTQGLSTVLLGGEIDPELAAGATELAGLRLLPSGPTSELPAELLESGRMADLLKALRERYDAVILDGPPLGMTGDAATLARLADTVVWAIRSGASTRGELGWTKHLLRNLRADVAGAILTEAPRSGERRSYVYPALTK